MYAVVVTITVRPRMLDAFMALARVNAATSLHTETGCRQFDIAKDPARPNEVFLYEVYENRDSFDFHLASEHFHEFDSATADMIAEKAVKTYSEVTQ